MLVLTRQRDESIVINNDIEVTVVDVRGDKVRLGITAPDNIAVHRKEVFEKIRRANEEAARADIHDSDLGAGPKTAPRAVSIGQPNSQAKVFPRLVSEMPHDPFMKAAVDEALLGMKEGGLPIGAVLVRAGKIIGRGHNRRVQRGDPMAHAEIDCLTRAGRQKTYADTVLYSTLMPCFLCSGATVQFGIPKVIAGQSSTFTGGVHFLREKGIEVVDLKDATCIEMLETFIAQHGELWNEDIGK